MNDAFYIAGVPEAMPLFEGWVGIAGWDEENPVWAAGVEEFERWYGGPPKHPEIFAVWYSLAMAARRGHRARAGSPAATGSAAVWRV